MLAEVHCNVLHVVQSIQCTLYMNSTCSLPLIRIQEIYKLLRFFVYYPVIKDFITSNQDQDP